MVRKPHRHPGGSRSGNGTSVPNESRIRQCKALTNDEIADRLTLSPATVRAHVSRAMTKLAARDRAQPVVFAYQSGLAPGNVTP